MKAGANKVDQAKIARMAKGGYAIDDKGSKAEPMSAKEISTALNIELKCVENFMNGKKAAPKKAAK